ncbi:hypothetical protein GLOTRDRAFT_130731 [Gloeophyllum trabeum ATCC 11539]|uniref:DUF427 domain-containing protein n=1 Tax=Gloeophyllum trabeum (strain ATCC 11539 / FP-39264 / Madison 617) TaxID=670483 RepID=S7Q4E6_GLOTA|nr:uncharacterized protein GLOTRDRAFT_130731 [Gloeophyllum trabeum ATCC 11539]EPQ54382.1 hypothetical protein GLOTRDRAFT_130731 [Gloeophyllum trabeum ATCC 11539]
MSFTLPHVETSPKRVHVYFNDKCIVDTRNAKLVWEHPNYPVYYFVASDIPKEFLQEKAGTNTYDVVVEGRRAEGAATQFTQGDLKGLIKLAASAMDAWFEEDKQFTGHPKDPYKVRIDVLPSSRHVRVEVEGVEVANSQQPRLLFETGLITRYYIPRSDCRMDLLEPSELTTHCPYKGDANYFNVRLPNGKLVENVVWYYDSPYAECADVKGCLAFYDEKLDVWLDGEKQPRPKTPFRRDQKA